VAKFLDGHSDVVNVIFPGLQDGESRRRADAVKTVGSRESAVKSFESTVGSSVGSSVSNCQLLAELFTEN
jgi:O-acetylhomoserine/O-acetylserine sulfhydrylase-like pyridoxal-dependent enzyme